MSFLIFPQFHRTIDRSDQSLGLEMENPFEDALKIKSGLGTVFKMEGAKAIKQLIILDIEDFWAWIGGPRCNDHKLPQSEIGVLLPDFLEF